MARSELSRGEVTFLFTDIEGSTRLIDELGEDGYVEALTDHRLLLARRLPHTAASKSTPRAMRFSMHSRTPRAAVAAAAAGQQALEARPVKVRVGLHTAEPVLP